LRVHAGKQHPDDVELFRSHRVWHPQQVARVLFRSADAAGLLTVGNASPSTNLTPSRQLGAAAVCAVLNSVCFFLLIYVIYTVKLNQVQVTSSEFGSL
jgi:hypothetical protein